MRILLAAAGLSSLLLAACGGSNSCEDVISNAAKLYGFGGEGYGAVRARAIAECKDEKWNEKLRTCAVAAKNKRDFDDCEKYKHDDAAADYGKKSKKSDAEVKLESLRKGLKVTYAENAEYPRGSAPLTPSLSCCEHSPDRKCPATVGEWADNPIWSALDFSVDEPSYFQYSYESTDGQTAVVHAVGDLDCDLTTATWELRCEAPAGNPSCTITKPDRAD